MLIALNFNKVNKTKISKVRTIRADSLTAVSAIAFLLLNSYFYY